MVFTSSFFCLSGPYVHRLHMDTIHCSYAYHTIYVQLFSENVNPGVHISPDTYRAGKLQLCKITIWPCIICNWFGCILYYTHTPVHICSSSKSTVSHCCPIEKINEKNILGSILTINNSRVTVFSCVSGNKLYLNDVGLCYNFCIGFCCTCKNIKLPHNYKT